MAEAKERLGKLPCSRCKEPTQVKRNTAGTLTQACDECGWSTFVRRGDRAHGELLAELAQLHGKPAAPSPAPAPAPASSPAPAPTAPKPEREAFSFEALK